MATVAKRRNRYVVDWRDASGRRRWKSFTKLKEANAYRDEVSQQTRRGIVVDERLTFDTFVADYRRQHLESGAVRPGTKADYESLLKCHLEPYFRGWRLRDIRRADVLKFRGHLLDNGVGRRTINKALSLLGTLFNIAQENERVHHQPVKNVMLPKQSDPDDDDFDDDVQVLSLDEQRRLIAAANGGFRVLLLTALGTGLRQGELLGLKWKDIDLGAGRLSVRRQYTRGAFAQCKTKNARREIPLPPSLVHELKQWKLACPRVEGHSVDLVFPNSLGKPESATNLRKRQFYPTLRRAKLRQVRFHALRHTYVSSLIANGVQNIKRLQMLLGHSSATITLDTYAHLLPDSDDGVAAAAELALFGASGSKTVAANTKTGAGAPVID